MAKPNWKTAPPEILRAIEQRRRDTRLTAFDGSAMTVAALGTFNALRAAHARGYDIPPEEVPTPAHDQLAAFTGDAVQRAQLRVLLSLELDWEVRSKRLAESMRKWAEAPSAVELAQAAQQERERIREAADLEARADAILASDVATRVEKARTTARAQAARELQKGK